MSCGVGSCGNRQRHWLQGEFDARQANQFVDPVERLHRHAQGASPTAQWTGHGSRVLLRACVRSRAEDGVKTATDGLCHGVQAGRGPCIAHERHAATGFIERCRRPNALRCHSLRRAPMADDRQFAFAFHHIARVVAARPKLDQGRRSARAEFVDVVRGEDDHGALHRPGPPLDPNFCSGYGRERSGRWV